MSATPFEIGQVLVERYRLDGMLGMGGMSWVFRATDLHLDRIVAIKILRDVAAQHAGRLVREARAVAALRHPSVVGIHDLGTLEDDRPYIVLEFIEGQTLAERLDAGPLDVDEALALFRPVLEGLAEAHAANIVHRDLKPDNLMLEALPGGRTRCRVLDFGIAAVELMPEEERYTQTGAVFGTPEYMAPEQALGRRPTTATDVWALGAVLQATMTGSSPFTGRHPPEILFKVVQKPPTRLPDAVPSRVRTIIDQCLRKDPAERPQGAQDLAELLWPPVEISTAEAKPDRQWLDRRLAVAGAALLLLGFVLGLVVAPTGRGERPTPIAQPSMASAVPVAPTSATSKASESDDAAVLAPAEALLSQDPPAVLAWLTTHTEGPPAARQLLRGRARLKIRKARDQGIADIKAALTTDPKLLTAAVIPALCDGLSHVDAEPFVGFLVQLWPESEQAVMDLASAGRLRARRRAVEVVKQAGGDVSAAQLAALLRDLKVGDCSQRERAGIALGKLGNPAAIPALKRANNRGLIDNYCMGDSLNRAIYRLRRIDKGE